MVQCSDVYFWRQGLVLLSDCLYCFGAGFFLSFPGVLNAAILSPNSTDLKATPDQASWIAGSQGIAGIVGYLILPAVMQIYGRKAAHYGINGSVSLGFIIFYFATNITCLYIARLIQGLALTGVYITAIILAEYSAPKRRGYFNSIKKSSVALGSLVCHWLSVVCTWREIALIGSLPNILSIILTIPWPESPAYLAMKGDFAECDKSHTWLHGNSPQSRKQLEELISAQTQKRDDLNKGCVIRNIWKNITRKDLLRPIIIATLLTIVVESCGRYYNFAYIVQIMTNIVKDQSVSMYCSLGNDILTLVGLWCSCYVVVKLNRRTILLACGFGSVILMFLICVTILLRDFNYVGSSLNWLPPCFILINSFITNLGVIPISFTITGEIFPLEHRGLGTCIIGFFFTIIYGIVLKCTPLMIDAVDIKGTYGIYGLITFICLTILYFILIETKDKTLQEIENEIKGTEINNESLLTGEHFETKFDKTIAHSVNFQKK